MKMQTGIRNSFGYPIPQEERLKLIASAGFDSIFFWWGDQYAAADGPKEAIPDLARKAGLSVEAIHTDSDNASLIWLEDDGWEVVFNRYMSSIEACYKYQIPTMVVHMTHFETAPAASDTGFDRIKRMADLAERRNVNIAFENARRNEYLSLIFERIQSDKLKFCYDSGHENCFTKKGDLLDKFGYKLICLHLHDNDGTRDQHRMPGEGNIDWDALAAKLKEQKYHGIITLEVTKEYSQKYKDISAEQFLRDAYEHAKKIAVRCE